MPRYTEEHYKDVAHILKHHCQPPYSGPLPPHLARDFADLFAADNPPTCQVGHHDGPCGAVCLVGGFDRERFLEACGVEA